MNNTGPANDSTEKLLADIRTLPGQASILITPLDGGNPLLSYNADRHLGIGSAFKLYILSTLAHQVAAGKRSWGDVVPIATWAKLPALRGIGRTVRRSRCTPLPR